MAPGIPAFFSSSYTNLPPFDCYKLLKGLLELSGYYVRTCYDSRLFHPKNIMHLSCFFKLIPDISPTVFLPAYPFLHDYLIHALPYQTLCIFTLTIIYLIQQLNPVVFVPSQVQAQIIHSSQHLYKQQPKPTLADLFPGQGLVTPYF
jgi:hypothetical protein